MASLAAVAVYWVGLSGPLLFDDTHVFAVVKGWLQGKNTLSDVLFGNTSWVTHRSLAMASFAVNAWLFGFDPFGFKLGNLLLHVCTGLCAFPLLRRLMQRDADLSKVASGAAVFVVAVWLLHPLHVTTVLYSVQRMAQWAALACILGLWLYVTARERADRGDPKPLWWTLLLWLPLATLVGIQGKQNAIVLPLLCLVVELAYFGGGGAKRPRLVFVFFALLLAIGALGLLGLGVLRPELLTQGFAEYDFNPWQRLLSQSRVLADYLRQLVAPHSPSMGVFTDDFPMSYGFLSPPTTALASFLLITISGIAIALCKPHPSLFAGWFFFLVAHSVESTVLPLELYYEHRNYLPSFGLFLAIAGFVAIIARALANLGLRMGRIGVACGGALLIVLALQTHGRARVWGDPLVLFSSEYKNHPKSVRAAINLIGVAYEVGDHKQAFAVADEFIANNPEERSQGKILLFRAWLECTTMRAQPLQSLDAAVGRMHGRLDATAIHLVELVVSTLVRGTCGEPDRVKLAAELEQLADQATEQPDAFAIKIALRNRSALLYAAANRWDKALEQSLLGWQPTTGGRPGVLLVQALLVQGQPDEAARVLEDAIRRARAADDAQAVRLLQPLRRDISEEREAPGAVRRRLSAPD